MLSLALALVLSQAPIADKTAPAVHFRVAAKAKDCPLNGSIEASNPAIARPEIGTGPHSGFPDMVHMPTVDFIYALNQTIDGCFTPKFVNGPRIIIRPPNAIVAPKP